MLESKGAFQKDTVIYRLTKENQSMLMKEYVLFCNKLRNAIFK